MDYASPALLAVLAVLGIAIYARLGRLKKEGGEKRDPEPQVDRDHAVRMYAVTAKAEAENQTVKMHVQYKGAGGDLLKAIASKAVTEVFLKGCALAVATTDEGRASVSRADDGTYFTVTLDADKAKSPFFESGDMNNLEMNTFGEVYLMAH